MTDGADTIVLADVQGLAMNDLAKGTFITYSVHVPANWTQATLQISSYTDSLTNSEAVDFDHIFFTGLAAANLSLPGDANGDGVVNVNDLTIVLTNYGRTSAGAGIKAVPEPSALVLIGGGVIGLLGYVWRRRT